MANYAMAEVDYLGRYAKDIFDGGLVDVVDSGDTEEALVREIANNFGLEVIPVCQALIDAIGNISVQLGLINGSIQVAGTVDSCCIPVGSNPADDAPPLGDPDVDDPPDDWVTWAAYNTYKCRAANKIADDWISTLGNLATLSGAAATIGALALSAFFSTTLLSGVLVGLMILGFSAFTAAAIIIGALVLMVLSGAGLLAYFADLAQDLSDNKETLVCQLFGAQSPSEAATIVINFTLASAALISYDPGDDDALFQAQLSSIVSALFNSSVTNLLFELDDEVDGYVGTIDCDDCACVFTLEHGTGDINYLSQSFVLSSVPEGGNHRIRIDMPLAAAGEACNREVTVISGTYETGGPNWLRELYCMEDTPAFQRIFDGQGAAFPATPQDIAILDARNGTAFTLTLSITPNTEPACV